MNFGLGEIETIEIKGFVINKEGDKTIIEKNVGRNKFVPHQISFYKVIIQKIKDQIK